MFTIFPLLNSERTCR